MKSKSLFIATPISTFSSNDEYMRFRSWIMGLTKKITESEIFGEVFCVACIVKSQSSLNDPIESLVGDIAELEKASHFLFIYPVETPTSALIELGYALAKNKTIIIAHAKDTALPFMATKLDKVYQNIKKLELDEFNNNSMAIVLRALSVK